MSAKEFGGNRPPETRGKFIRKAIPLLTTSVGVALASGADKNLLPQAATKLPEQGNTQVITGESTFGKSIAELAARMLDSKAKSAEASNTNPFIGESLPIISAQVLDSHERAAQSIPLAPGFRRIAELPLIIKESPPEPLPSNVHIKPDAGTSQRDITAAENAFRRQRKFFDEKMTGAGKAEVTIHLFSGDSQGFCCQSFPANPLDTSRLPLVIEINTNSHAWTQMKDWPDQEELFHEQSMGHEQVHERGRERIGNPDANLNFERHASWINEGGAQFLSFAPLIEEGKYSEEKILRQSLDDVRFSQAKQLSDLEDEWPANNEAYSLAYLGIRQAVKGSPNGLKSIDIMYAELGKGKTINEAFTSGFGRSLPQFYAEFRSYLSSVQAAGGATVPSRA
jgi:hypothetical protein